MKCMKVQKQKKKKQTTQEQDKTQQCTLQQQ